MDPIEEKKKIDWKKVLITTALVLLTAGLVGGGVWYFMDRQSKSQDEVYNKTTESMQKQIDELKKDSTKTVSTSTNKTSDAVSTQNWKTYTNSVYKYQVKYPDSYVYKEYGSGVRTEENPVCFAKTEGELPSGGSDAPCPVKIYRSDEPYRVEGQGVTKETLVINGKSVTKFVVPANTPNKFGSWSERVYVIPYYASYLILMETNNYAGNYLSEMANTLTLY